MRVPIFFAICISQALAHDQALTHEQKAALANARLALQGALTERTVQTVAETLKVFSLSELSHIEHSAEFRALSSTERDRLRRSIKVVLFVRKHGTHVEDPWHAGMLLASPRWRDWLEAMRILQRQEFATGLERVAVHLSSDERPQIRAGAGRLAKALTVFRGPSPACEAVAKRVLSDPVPNVVAMFGAYDAHDFRSRDITDLVVARLGDERGMEPVAGLLHSMPGTVGGWIGGRLSGELLSRYGGAPLRRVSAADQAVAIRNWWKENGAQYDYGPNSEEWRLVVTWVGTVERGKRVRVSGEDLSLFVTVIEYEEYWNADGRPVYDATLQIEGEEGFDESSFGFKGREDLSAAMAGVHTYTTESFFAPNTHDEVRMALRVWRRRGRSG